MRSLSVSLATAALLGGAAAGAAQEPIGATAPAFAFPGATRYGVLKEPVRLSDFHGKTVVLAFFFRARTRG